MKYSQTTLKNSTYSRFIVHELFSLFSFVPQLIKKLYIYFIKIKKK